MDVTSLLNTAGSSSKPPRTSASPAITESGHTVPSSALPTPSPERAIGPSEYERSPRQNPSLWGPRGYSLSLALEPKPRSGSVFSYQADGRTETESDSGPYNSSRNNSVCSGEVFASLNSPRTISSRNLLPFISPEQSDAEHGGMEPRNSATASHSSQSTYASSASRPHSRVSSVTTIGALHTGKDVTLHHARRNSLDHSANQRDFQPTSQAEEEEFRSLQANGTLASKLHKRTMSAPDIAQCSVARMPRHAAQPIISEIVPSRPSIDQSAEDSRRSSAATDAGGNTAAASSVKPQQQQQQDQEAYCMFVKDCDTGSQLRKAISHLFGRNKACTLRIPKHVWVYYCRKHYQRIRYRNAKTYPLNQMELVKLQILRLQAWSEDNRKQQNGAYIRMWTLSLRKREQSRIENGSAGGGMADDASAAVNDARSIAGTAVPEWLIQRVAAGYTTEEILDVAERLHKEIKDGLLAEDQRCGAAHFGGRRSTSVSTALPLVKRCVGSTSAPHPAAQSLIAPIDVGSNLHKNANSALGPHPIKRGNSYTRLSLAASLIMVAGPDSRFGPQLVGHFDFTLLFGQIFFEIVPATLMILATPVYAKMIMNKASQQTKAGLLLWGKMAIGASLASISVAKTVLWQVASELQSQCSIAAPAMTVVASLFTLVVLYGAHLYNKRLSSFVSLFFTLTLLLDISLARSYFIRYDMGFGIFRSIAALQITAILLKLLLVILEEVPKTPVVGEVAGTAVAQSDFRVGFWNRVLFFWVNTMLLHGFGHELDVDGLPEVDEQLESRVLFDEFSKHWPCLDKTSKYALMRACLRTIIWKFLFMALPRL
uniref:Uncharacterized protein n=1 Tax=Lecanicillium saksenae TaxID=468837 RepID=A0ACC1R3W9_9HYPO